MSDFKKDLARIQEKLAYLIPENTSVVLLFVHEDPETKIIDIESHGYGSGRLIKTGLDSLVKSHISQPLVLADGPLTPTEVTAGRWHTCERCQKDFDIQKEMNARVYEPELGHFVHECGMIYEFDFLPMTAAES